MIAIVLKLILVAALKVALATLLIGALIVIIAAAGYLAVRGTDAPEDAEVDNLW